MTTPPGGYTPRRGAQRAYAGGYTFLQATPEGSKRCQGGLPRSPLKLNLQRGVAKSSRSPERLGESHASGIYRFRRMLKFRV